MVNIITTRGCFQHNHWVFNNQCSTLITVYWRRQQMKRQCFCLVGLCWDLESHVEISPVIISGWFTVSTYFTICGML